jgi:hypothetical protein
MWKVIKLRKLQLAGHVGPPRRGEETYLQNSDEETYWKLALKKSN